MNGIKKHNKEHPDNLRQSKLDLVKFIVTQTTCPGYEDYYGEVIAPFGIMAAENWVSIYFGDGWGMQ